MKIEEGKFYRTRAGRKAGPMLSCANGWDGSVEGGYAHRPWLSDGVHLLGDSDLDLVAEWTDESTGPVRTVTRKEIVPGTYGFVEIDDTNDAVQPEGVSIWLPANRRYNEAELRATAATLTEIADALGEAS